MLRYLNNAKSLRSTPIPREGDRTCEDNAASGVISGARSWEDSDNVDDIVGFPILQAYLDCRTEEDRRERMGAGVPEVGTPAAHQGGQSYWYPKAEAFRAEQCVANIYREFRKLEMALGLESEVRHFSDRREQQIQGSEYAKVQSLEEELENFSEKNYSYRYASPTETDGPLVPSWYTGPRTKARNFDY